MEPLIVEVVRGETVESRHRVHAVAVRDGEVVELAGDPELVTFLRSSAKPIQALPLARAYPDLSADRARDRVRLAPARSPSSWPPSTGCSRSRARPRTTSSAAPRATPPSRLRHNCSGKHAGMLAVCRAHGWPTEGYRLPEHPLQQLLLAEVAAVAGVAAADIPTATDGCGVVTFAFSLERMAGAFARLRELDGGDRVAAAMRAHPGLMPGPARRTRCSWRAPTAGLRKGARRG